MAGWRPAAFVLLTAAAAAAIAAEPPEPVERAASQRAAPGAVEVLSSASALPAHIAGRFREPIQFVRATTGESLVLDRRAHRVFIVDAAGRSLANVVDIGLAPGEVLSPSALSIAPNNLFAVADAPSRYERIQYFRLNGQPVGAFYLDERRRFAPRLSVGPLLLSGVGSMQFTGDTFLVSQPESGALISELDTRGAVTRRIGLLRDTGHEAGTALHLALNTGVPLVDPTGGFYFVFQTGRPMFRRYDADGTLLYERHIEGAELDASIQALPTEWPSRTFAGESHPLVPPLVRTAAVDEQGQLWVSLVEPYTYVYDTRGDKTRTVQFRGAGIVAPTSLFFAADGRLLVTPGCYEFAVR